MTGRNIAQHWGIWFTGVVIFTGTVAMDFYVDANPATWPVGQWLPYGVHNAIMTIASTLVLTGIVANVARHLGVSVAQASYRQGARDILDMMTDTERANVSQHIRTPRECRPWQESRAQSLTE